MSCFVISGKRPLSGEITAGGSKNAALPIIFATVAARGVSYIENVPDITDVEVAIELIRALGAVTERRGTTLTVDTTELSATEPDRELLLRIRASAYLLGASLARFGEAFVCKPGGCAFESRPIDLHLMAFYAMGATLRNGKITLGQPRDSHISFPKVTVGATANALILAAGLDRETRITGYAREPHIYTLIDFLISAGAKIEEDGTAITVHGGDLHGGRAVIPPDPIETGTYAILSLLTDGGVRVRGSAKEELSSLLEPLSVAGATVVENDGALSLSGGLALPVCVTAAPYPALPTDLQPPLSVALGAFSGGEICDTVFPRRFGYLEELSLLGLKSFRTEGKARILPSGFHRAEARAPDLRGGAALVLASLLAEGETLIESSETVLRGYSDIVKKLRGVGADIYVIK